MTRFTLIGFILTPPLTPRRMVVLKGHRGVFLSVRAWHKIKDREILHGRKSGLVPTGELEAF